MVVVDTHVLIWWVSGDTALTTTADKVIQSALVDDGGVIVSSISAWEVAMLVQKGRLVLSMDVESWLDTVARIDGLRFLPVDEEIAVKSTLLPGMFHKDPADRMIVATARRLAAPLVTADQKIIDYEHVKTVW